MAAVYNVEKDSWRILDNFSGQRDGTSLVVIGSRIFAIGSYDGDIVEEFNPRTFTWDH